jgi:hypothetical protein
MLMNLDETGRGRGGPDRLPFRPFTKIAGIAGIVGIGKPKPFATDEHGRAQTGLDGY